MLKILSGKARGRQIKSPPGKVRPATARVRKAIFDYLSGFIPDARVLDLYCGSGGLGLEALSRGACEAWFVDLSERSINVAKQNAVSLGLNEQTRFICKDVFRFLRMSAELEASSFDLIFAAPPYRIARPKQILESIADAQIIAPNGAVCLEYSRHNDSPESSHFTLDRRKIYGETVIDVWDWNNRGSEKDRE